LERFKECQDCKRRDAKITDLDNRVKDLTEYIRKSNDKKGQNKKSLEDILTPVHS
jgi:signal transduction histidine kinase